MRWVWRGLAVIGVLLLAAVLLGMGLVRRQGLPRDFWKDFDRARVVFDADGIPTIEASSWEAVIEAQGYVVAADRFFQMDLLRRSSAGRLAEFFGTSLVAFDRAQRALDAMAVADREYEELPERHRRFVDAYTRGVNSFLVEHPGRVGIEFVLLGKKPELWRGRDSLLVLLAMNRQLSQAKEDEVLRTRWKGVLPPAWFEFLFPRDHPWNEPLFGTPRPPRSLPASKLPHAPLGPEELAAKTPAPVAVRAGGSAARGGPTWADPPRGASNSWVYCRAQGCFVANDPHLGATVPHIWYANRLRVSSTDWVVGVSIPGLPGVVLGMNPGLAWAFTNVGEDVDDYLEEELSADGARYLARHGPDGKAEFEPIRTVRYRMEVRGAPAVEGEARFTHRGPLSGSRSRQWLPLKEGMLRLPLELPFARSGDELDRALDDMRSPAQNVVFADREGNHGYRASGTGVRRRVSGRFVQEALRGEWQGFQPSSDRPRRRVAAVRSATVASFIANANERVWVDAFGHPWGDDLRKDRIRRVLSAPRLLDHADMSALQLDTVSRFARLIVGWVADRAELRTDADRATVARWRAWNGAITEDPRSYAEARTMERALFDVLVGRVRRQYLPRNADSAYRTRLETAWLIEVLETPGAMTVFGIDARELADALLARARSSSASYPQDNRWRAQHPLARIPVLGWIFEVAEPPQIGGHGVPRVERPTYGASCRLVWNLGDPAASTWSLPVGQSGHAGSSHYSDLMDRFHRGQPIPVFDPAFDWGFEDAALQGRAWP